jgi:serine/threonine protein kinase
MDSNYKIKYNKYKEKYLNLKKLIGSGKEADAYANFMVRKFNRKMKSITPHPDDKNIILYDKNKILLEQYTWGGGDYIGVGAYGLVYIIYDSENNKYIIKISNTTLSEVIQAYNIIDEGTRTDILKGILDDKSIPKYQGKLINTHDKSEYGYLISEYNGKTLLDTYTDSIEINDKNMLFISILSSIFESIFKLNTKNIYHNDIKLDNIVISDVNIVRLIDFGLLTEDKPEIGTIYSMSVKSVIHMRSDLGNIDLEFINKISNKHKLTDCFGFFYCCVDLLNLWSNRKGRLSSYILHTLGCANHQINGLNNLMNLYYYILPKNIKLELPIPDSESESELFDTTLLDEILPNVDETKECFNEFNIEIIHINLYRYICYIYENIIKKDNNFVNKKELKKFLIIISECLKYNFNINMEFSEKFQGLNLFLS